MGFELEAKRRKKNPASSNRRYFLPTEMDPVRIRKISVRSGPVPLGLYFLPRSFLQKTHHVEDRTFVEITLRDT